MIPLSQARLPEIMPEFLSSWVGVLLLLGGLVLMGMTIVEKFKVKKASNFIVSPDPMRVEGVEKLATRGEVAAMGARLERDIEEIREAIGIDRAKTHTEVVAIHNRINAIATHTDTIAGSLTEIGKNVALLLQRSMK